MDHYLYISNQDSEVYYPSNTADLFTVNCQQTICLPGIWKVALTEISLTLDFGEREQPDYVCITTDFIEPSYVAGGFKQILRRIRLPQTATYSEIFTVPYYYSVNANQLNSFLIVVLDGKLGVSGLRGEISFTLHLRQIA